MADKFTSGVSVPNLVGSSLSVPSPDTGFVKIYFVDDVLTYELPNGNLYQVTGTLYVPPTNLLDVYSGATGAYSLRKLRGAQTNAIRVRRSSDNAEQDIGFSGSDLDTASLSSFVGAGGSDNGFVTTWYDQSGNGYNLTQTTSSAQPVIVSSGVVVTQGTNSKPAIQFGTGLYLQSTTFTQSQPDTIYMVVNAAGAGAQNAYDGSSTVPARQVLFRDGSGNIAMFAGTVLASGTAWGTSQRTLVQVYNGASSSLWNNTTQIASGQANTQGLGGATLFTMGAFPSGNTWWSGRIAEWVCYPNSGTDRTGITGNIQTYYGT